MKLRYLLTAFLSLLLPMQDLYCQEDSSIIKIRPQPLAIKLSQPDSPGKLSAKDRKKWVSACKKLGRNLTSGLGPWGHGVFQSFTCFVEDKVVAKKKNTGVVFAGYYKS